MATDPSLNFHPEIERPPYQTLLSFPSRASAHGQAPPSRALSPWATGTEGSTPSPARSTRSGRNSGMRNTPRRSPRQDRTRDTERNSYQPHRRSDITPRRTRYSPYPSTRHENRDADRYMSHPRSRSRGRNFFYRSPPHSDPRPRSPPRSRNSYYRSPPHSHPRKRSHSRECCDSSLHLYPSRRSGQRGYRSRSPPRSYPRSHSSQRSSGFRYRRDQDQQTPRGRPLRSPEYTERRYRTSGPHSHPRSRYDRQPYRHERSAPRIRKLTRPCSDEELYADYRPYGTRTPKLPQLPRDVWFHILCFFDVPSVCSFHRVSPAVNAAAHLALRRVDKVHLMHKTAQWRTNILEAVLRGGCKHLKVLDVHGNIPTLGKIIDASTNLKKIDGLAPNLLSKLSHPLNSLVRLSLWVDENYTDDLSVVAKYCKDLRALRLTAKNGMTIYDEQTGMVLRECTKLERVAFHGVQVTNEIATEIRNLKSIHTLKLEDAGITDEVCQTLVDNLASPTLRSLSLKHNSLTPTGVASIGRSELLQETLLGLNICGSGDIYAGTFHMVCRPNFLPKLRALRVAMRLVHVFEKEIHKTRPKIEVCARGLGALHP